MSFGCQMANGTQAGRTARYLQPFDPRQKGVRRDEMSSVSAPEPGKVPIPAFKELRRLTCHLPIRR